MINSTYSKLRKDRSGAQILDMLYCYSFSLAHNFNYQGAWFYYKKMRDREKSYLPETTRLCNFLGLPEPLVNGDKNILNKIIPEEDYSPKNNYDEIFNDDFKKILIDKNKPNLKPIKQNNNDFIVALHIRRGDVKKDNKWSFRYTQNSYYLKIIDDIKNNHNNAKIYVFSESKSQESFDDFTKLGCIMKLDTDLVEAWNYFIQADILVLASSAFSIVPAIYNQNKVIYVWNKYFQPLKGWIQY